MYLVKPQASEKKKETKENKEKGNKGKGGVGSIVRGIGDGIVVGQ